MKLLAIAIGLSLTAFAAQAHAEPFVTVGEVFDACKGAINNGQTPAACDALGEAVINVLGPRAYTINPPDVYAWKRVCDYLAKHRSSCVSIVKQANREVQQ